MQVLQVPQFSHGIHAESYAWLQMHRDSFLSYLAVRLGFQKGRVCRILTTQLFNRRVTTKALEAFLRQVGTITDTKGRAWRFTKVEIHPPSRANLRRGGRRYLVFRR